MTTTDLRPGEVWTTTAAHNGAVPRRRLHGLRMPVLPSGAWLAQVGGGLAALAGTYLQWGGAVAAIVSGVAAVVLGALREAGKV